MANLTRANAVHVRIQGRQCGPLTQDQVKALVRQGTASPGDSISVDGGQHWTHIAMARESRLMLEVIVGPRTQESATKLVEGAAKRLAPDCWPLWSSDGWEPYLFALTVVFAVLIHFIKGKGRGRPKDSQVVPDPRVRYGQVVKQRAGRRLVAVR